MPDGGEGGSGSSSWVTSFCSPTGDRSLRSRLVYTEAAGNGGAYNYFLCRGRQEGTCDLPYLPVSEVEEMTARRFGAEQVDREFIDTIRAGVDEVLGETQQADIAMRANLAKQLKKLDVREERLLDLASDGELSTPKLKARLQTTALERGQVQERMGRTDADLARGAQTILV